MENILIIEKAKGMEKEGAIELLKYHQGLQETKKKRLARQWDNANEVSGAINKEIERRGKEVTG